MPESVRTTGTDAEVPQQRLQFVSYDVVALPGRPITPLKQEFVGTFPRVNPRKCSASSSDRSKIRARFPFVQPI